MERTMDGLMQNWKEKYELKEIQKKKQELLDLKKIHHDMANDDIFEWLDSQIKYDALRQKFRAFIVQRVSEFDNISKMIDGLNEKEMHRSAGDFYKANQVKVKLDQVNVTTSKDVFANMKTYGNPKTQLFLSRLGLGEQVEHENSAQLDLKNAENDSQENMSQVKQLLSSKRKEHKEWQVWDQERESQFYQNRNDKRQIYTYEITVSNWNKIGLLPFVQKYIIDLRKSMQRENLMQKYAEGGYLSADQYQFLTNTSKLLNSCVNQNFVQNAVNIIDDDLLSNLELGLAEEIIQNYEKIQKAVKQCRQDFLEQKDQILRNQISQFQRKDAWKREVEKNKFLLKKQVNMMKGACIRMEKNNLFEDKPPENVRCADYVDLFLKGKIDTQDLVLKIKTTNFAQSREELENEQKEKLRKELEDKQIKNYLKKISTPVNTETHQFKCKKIRHKVHPNSKLLMNPTDQDGNEIIHNSDHPQADLDQSLQEEMIRREEQKASDVNKFALTTKANPIFQNKPRFRDFYTGGPDKSNHPQRLYDPFTMKLLPITKQELKALIQLQGFFRRGFYRRRFKERLKALRQEKEKIYKDIIEKIKNIREPRIIYNGGGVKYVRVIDPDQKKIPGEDHETEENFHEQPSSLQMSRKDNQSVPSFHSRYQSQARISIDVDSSELVSRKHETGYHYAQPRPQTTQGNANRLSTIGITASTGLPTTKSVVSIVNFSNLNQTSNNNNNHNRSSISNHNKVTNGTRIDGVGDESNSSPLHRNGSNASGLISTKFSTQLNTISKNKSMVNLAKSNSSYNLLSRNGSGVHTTPQGEKIHPALMDRVVKQFKPSPLMKAGKMQMKTMKLLEAAKRNQISILLSSQMRFVSTDLNFGDTQGNTALHYVTQNSNSDFLTWLLDRGADPNLQNLNGETPLHYAFATNRYELLAYGADLNAVNYNLETPLAYGSQQFLSLLLMTEGITHINSYTDINWDNNHLLFQKLQENDKLFVDYANFRSRRINQYSIAAVVEVDLPGGKQTRVVQSFG